MNSQIIIDVGGKPVKIYMQEGFFEYKRIGSWFHEHRLMEMHAIAEGTAVFWIEGKTVEVSAGELLLIEGGVFHKCESYSDDLLRVVFQFDCFPLPVGEKYFISKTVLHNTIEAIDVCVSTGKFSRLRAYLTLICNAFLPQNNAASPEPITDREFIIYEFFSKNYNTNATIGALAEELGVCKKQAQRLVEKYTGNDFRTEIAEYRIRAAKRLMTQGKMTLAQVAENVGYRSYSGFWKAYKSATKEE